MIIAGKLVSSSDGAMIIDRKIISLKECILNVDAMKQPITISLIAPVYRVEKYIGKFADSVFSQSYPHVQFIFVNDGTDDSSMEILNSMIENEYSHLKERVIIVNQPHSGLPFARESGVRYATGDYIWHVDSDDWVEKDAVERIVSKIEETGSDLIYFNFIQEYTDRSKVKRERNYEVNAASAYVRNIFNHKSYACVWNKCVRRSVYDSHKIYYARYSYSEDAYLMTQVVSYSKSIAYLDAELYHYRKDNQSSLSHQKRRIRRLEYSLNFLDLYEKFRYEAPGNNPVSLIADMIMLRSGWHSMVYNLGLFARVPYLAEMITDAELSLDAKTGIIPQIVTKAYSYCRCMMDKIVRR